MNTNLQQALQFATNALSDFARGMNFWSGFELAFGQDYDREKAELIRQSAIDGTFMVPVRVIDDRSMGIASGAFAAATDTIYLRDSLIRSGNIRSIGAVILEELGHAIDSRVNRVETPGDEGAIFQMLTNGYDICADLLAKLKVEDDWGTIVVDHQTLIVEMAVINGTSGNDFLSGTNIGDVISGLAGNDSIYGGDGNDSIYGGDGTDTIYGGNELSLGSANDFLDGGNGNDYFSITSGSSTINGGSGIDTLFLNRYKSKVSSAITFSYDGSGVSSDGITIQNIEKFSFYGSEGNDFADLSATAYANYLYGNTGQDTLFGGSGNDTLEGGSDDDYLYGGDGNDTIGGGAEGNDLIEGNSGDDYLYDEKGNNTIMGGSGDDIVYASISSVVDGGEGNDYLSISYYNSTSAFNISFDADLSNSTIKGIERFELKGSNYDDYFNATLANFSITVSGGSGNDTLLGGVGNDTLFGIDGNDFLDGGNGNDYLYDIEGNNTLKGGLGNDTIITVIGNVIDGGEGNDSLSLSYQSSNISAVIDTVSNQSTTNVIYGIEMFSFIGSQGNDYVNAFEITGSSSLSGGSGNDTLIGGNGNDRIYGGWGDDYLDGGAGDDLLYGDDGSSHLIGGTGNDSIHGRSVNNYVDAGAGIDFLFLSYQYDRVTIIFNTDGYGTGTDTIQGVENLSFGGSSANDLIDISLTSIIADLFGSEGNDSLIGGNANDTLSGGNGNDLLNGEGGNDFLNGGSGNNTLIGNSGDDSYSIYYFDRGINVIDDIAGIDNLQLVQNLDITKDLRAFGKTLLVDVGKNNQFELSILNFFSIAGIAGSGYIEKINSLDSAIILDRFRKVRNDFGNDKKSDILWRNINGDVYTYQMNGSIVSSESSLGNVSNDWQIAGTGDFNGDNKSDILWRNSITGAAYVWQMNGNTKVSEGQIRGVSNDWQIVGTGDFNGDNKSDILWRNINSGSTYIYQMDGLTVIAEGTVRNVSNDWQIAGTGDFNGDGKSDILWRNVNSGLTYAYLMDGKSVIGEGSITTLNSDWVIEGVDDFNADGKSDILCRNNSNSQVYIYQMSGLSIQNEGVAGGASADWNIAGTGDYNGDSKADILWRNNSGLTSLWTMDGFNQLSQDTIRQVDNSWQIAAPTL
jgi:Ca2+-binding RTX toxin-like protein